MSTNRKLFSFMQYIYIYAIYYSLSNHSGENRVGLGDHGLHNLWLIPTWLPGETFHTPGRGADYPVWLMFRFIVTILHFQIRTYKFRASNP